MSGERNGTQALLCRVNGASDLVIVGQVELTNTFNGAPIEITTKSNNDFVAYLDGELSTKGRTISLTCTYNNNAEFERLRSKAESGEIESYVIDYTTLDVDRVEFNGIPTQLSDNLAQGDKVTTSVSILSVGADL